MHLIVLEYAKWLVNARNFSKSTIETYIRAVNALIKCSVVITFLSVF